MGIIQRIEDLYSMSAWGKCYGGKERQKKGLRIGLLLNSAIREILVLFTMVNNHTVTCLTVNFPKVIIILSKRLWLKNRNLLPFSPLWCMWLMAFKFVTHSYKWTSDQWHFWCPMCNSWYLALSPLFSLTQEKQLNYQWEWVGMCIIVIVLNLNMCVRYVI